MRCSSSSTAADLGFACSFISFLSFLDVSVSRAMGCFFGCFRVRDDDDHRRHRRSRSVTSREAIMSQNRLSSLFLSEGGDESPNTDGGSHNLGSPQINKELREEAKFLKACGTIVETPAEIRKSSRKFKASPSCDGDSEPSKIHSWLPNTSIKKLQLDQHPDGPSTPSKISENPKQGTFSSENTPSSCVSNVQNPGEFSISSVEGSGAGNSVCVEVKGNAHEADNGTTSDSPWLSPAKDRGKTKSVRFDCDFDMSSPKSLSENASQNSKSSDSPTNRSVSKNSPYPTPMKLSEEMQTPGTAFATNIEDVANGKARIRSQYVYSVENASQGKVPEEEGLNSYQLSGELVKSLEHPQNATPKSKAVEETSARKELDSNLSSWLKPVNSTQEVNSENVGAVSCQKPYFGRTPGDRPIIGMVAAHWNEDDSSRISPKWWDGNGIPNSTNKYKEDQKVSWHATPFEERLEKALSEESALPQRNFISGKPIAFDENDESDTALSQFQSSSHAKSVVSF